MFAPVLKGMIYRLALFGTWTTAAASMLTPGYGQKLSDEMVLLPMGSEWRYLDDGSDQGSAWRAPDFDDGEWKTGQGEFGYGDETHKTRISFGASSSNKFITTYFRTSFTAAPEDITRAEALRIDMMADDGAAVYLNGKEVHRVNLAENAAFQTTATETINNADEIPIPFFLVPLERLLPGRNTLAVELHQASRSSSDLAFDMNISLSRPLYGIPQRIGHHVRDARVHDARAALDAPVMVGQMALSLVGSVGERPHWLPLPIGGRVLAASDLNGDGLDEILNWIPASTYPSADLGLYVAGTGEASAAQQVIATRADTTEQLNGTFSDLDGDGLEDVVIVRNQSEEGNDEVTWRKNLGQLEFAAEARLIDLEQVNPGRIVAGDFTRDGRNDLVIVHEGAGARLYTQRDDGTFLSARRGAVPDPGDRLFIAARLDEDEKDDIVYLHGHALAGVNSIPEDLITAKGTHFNMAVYDFDDDGDNDLLMNDGESLYWNLNNGFGEFGSKRLVARTGPCEFGAAADMTGDGLADVVVNSPEQGVLLIPAISREAPAVVRFETGTPMLEAPGLVEITWNVLGADSVTVEPGLGAVVSAGSAMVDVQRTSTFRMTAVHDEVISTASLHVTVLAFAETLREDRLTYAPGGAIAAADLDGDQKDELLHQFDSTFSVYRQTAGGIEQTAAQNFRVPSNVGMTAADVDGDGVPDLLFHGSGRDSLFFQLSPFEFSARSEIPNYGNSLFFDFDGDSDLDVHAFNIAPDNRAGILEFRLGTFSEPPQLIDVPAAIENSLVWIDTDGSGSRDLVAVTNRGLLAFGVENGSPSGAETLLFDSTNQDRVTIGDYNGDNEADILLYSQEWAGVIGFPIVSGVLMDRGRLLGQFLDRETFGMQVNDLNGDGILDFVETGRLQWIRGKRDGAYVAEAQLQEKQRGLRNEGQQPYQDVFLISIWTVTSIISLTMQKIAARYSGS